MLTLIINQMDKGSFALFLFCFVSGIILLYIAKFARKTAITGVQIANSEYNLMLAKLMVVILPLIPIWCFTVKLCFLSNLH